MADPTSPSPYSENKRFEPKVPVELNEPKSDEITLEELAKNDGTSLAMIVEESYPMAGSIAETALFQQERTPKDQRGSRSRAPSSTSPRTKPTKRRVNIMVRFTLTTAAGSLIVV